MYSQNESMKNMAWSGPVVSRPLNSTKQGDTFGSASSAVSSALSSTFAAFAAAQSPHQSSSSGLNALSGSTLGAVGGIRPLPPPAYIIVCSKEGGDAVELPLDNEGALSLNTLQIEFSDAMGVKYRNPETGIYRIIAPDNDRLYPPSGGWGNHHYIACIPKTLEEKQKEPNSSLLGFKRPGPSPGSYYRQQEAPTYNYVPPPKVPMLGYNSYSQRGTERFQRGRGSFRGPERGRSRPMARGMPPRGRGGPPSRGTDNPPSRGRALPQKGQPTKVYDFCKICNLGLNGPDQTSKHYAGKKHLDKVQKAASGGTTGGGRGGTGGGAGGGRGGGGGAGVTPKVPSPGAGDQDFSKDDG